jgi:hypothetical protein
MSFHRPQDRHRGQKEQIQQQYHEARDKMSHAESDALVDGEGHEGAPRNESEEARKARFEQNIEHLLDRAGKQVRREYERGSKKS